MTDITERLRQQYPETPYHRDALHREAADAIESRDATIAELRAELAKSIGARQIIDAELGCQADGQDLDATVDLIRWCNAGAQQITAERDELRAQVEALRADAERYRWLRNGCDEKSSTATRIASSLWGMEWNDAIDAARSQEDKG